MHLSYSPALPAKLIVACMAAIALVAVPAAAQAPRPVPRPWFRSTCSRRASSSSWASATRACRSRTSTSSSWTPSRWPATTAASPAWRRPRPSKTGRRIDPDAAAVRAYEAHLDDGQASVLRAVPGVKAQVDYRITLAGFAAQLTGEQADALRKQPGVKRVTQERILYVTQSQEAPAAAGIGGSEPELLGLPGRVVEEARRSRRTPARA